MPATVIKHQVPRRVFQQVFLRLSLVVLLATGFGALADAHDHGQFDSAQCWQCQLDHNPALVIATPPASQCSPACPDYSLPLELHLSYRATHYACRAPPVVA
jgi:hypothetical protein